VQGQEQAEEEEGGMANTGCLPDTAVTRSSAREQTQRVHTLWGKKNGMVRRGTRE
jgi:hypothetical protein